MKTFLTYIMVLLLCLPSLGGVTMVFAQSSDDVDHVEDFEMLHSSNSQHLHEGSSNSDCHDLVRIVQVQKEDLQQTHDCCDEQSAVASVKSGESSHCEHDGCIECSVNCGSGFALLPGTPNVVNSPTEFISLYQLKLPLSPFQNHIKPPIS
jgi:hypothetical protein